MGGWVIWWGGVGSGFQTTNLVISLVCNREPKTILPSFFSLFYQRFWYSVEKIENSADFFFEIVIMVFSFVIHKI